jgi:hypothetical protein
MDPVLHGNPGRLSLFELVPLPFSFPLRKRDNHTENFGIHCISLFIYFYNVVVRMFHLLHARDVRQKYNCVYAYTYTHAYQETEKQHRIHTTASTALFCPPVVCLFFSALISLCELLSSRAGGSKL